MACIVSAGLVLGEYIIRIGTGTVVDCSVYVFLVLGHWWIVSPMIGLVLGQKGIISYEWNWYWYSNGLYHVSRTTTRTEED